MNINNPSEKTLNKIKLFKKYKKKIIILKRKIKSIYE